jgi:hypothetical protein
MTCEKCNRQSNKLIIHGKLLVCPSCRYDEPVGVAHGVIRDEIPGGVLIENLGRHPVRVYSQSERRALMKARGLEECVRWSGPMDRHVERWAAMDPYTMRAAAELVSRGRSVKTDETVADAPRPFNIAVDPDTFGEDNIRKFLEEADKVQPSEEAREAWQTIRSRESR